MNLFLIAGALWGTAALATLTGIGYLASRLPNLRRRPEPDASLDDLLDDWLDLAHALGVVAPKPHRTTRTIAFRCDTGRWTRGGAA